MEKKFQWATAALVTCFLGAGAAGAQEAQLARGRDALHSMTGCYLVDYSYAETEALKPGYTRDGRVYDVNGDKSVKEWIYADDLSPTRVRLQHVLFAVDLAGQLMTGSLLKHTGEDWQYDAPFLYDFSGPSHWIVKDLQATPGLWTRRVTNLDDGLRYQCAASWKETTAYPEWSCGSYAPIPGRETRDMGRTDYNTLERSNRLIAYGRNWLERQANTKTIDADGTRTPLANELGKDWYTRLPDSECAQAQAFVAERRVFWDLLRETWDGVLTGEAPFVETQPVGAPPRYVRLSTLEAQYLAQDLRDPAVVAAAKAAILKAIDDYRGH
jgi:hypothetical protein